MRKKRVFGRVGLIAAAVFGMTATCLSASTTLVGAPSTIFLGQSVTLTATVSGGAGNVTFYDGTTVLGVAAVSGTTAIFPTYLLTAGVRSLTAYFSGDKSTSAIFHETVDVMPATAFKAPLLTAVGTWPVSVAVGDFNNDGKQDVAVANWGSANVTVLLGKGNGKFNAAKTFSVDTNPHAIGVGDFNGDGKPDLAVVNMSGNVSILLNNGTPSLFNPAVDYPAGSTPYAIAVADFNNDGFPDLAVANDDVGVTVLTNNGDGTFTTLPTDTDVAPSSIAAAFFNADGYADLVVANPAGGSSGLSILLGKGDGTFGPPTNYKVGPRPYAVAVGDFDKDGAQDVVVTDYAGFVWVMFGVGDGTFHDINSYPVGMVPTSVAVGDVNGDGNPDWIITSSYSNAIDILLGDGHGGFHAGATYDTEPSMLPSSVAVGQFNGDERTDFVVADFYSDNVAVWLGDKFSISVVSGNGQSTKIKTLFPKKLVVIVKDSGGADVDGAEVTFTAPNSGASATFAGSLTATEPTNAGGQATSPPVKANGTVGSDYPVTASVGFGVVYGASTTFLLSNAP